MNLFSSKSSALPVLRNPLLILLDRDADLVQPLHHTANYQVYCSVLLWGVVIVEWYLWDSLQSCQYQVFQWYDTVLLLGQVIWSFLEELCRYTLVRDWYSLGRMFPDAADGNKECINEVMNKVEQVKMKTSTTESQSSMTDAFDDNL